MSRVSRDVIRVYALENAIKHNGKANQGAVLAGLFAEGLEKSEIKNIIPDIVKVLDEVNSMGVDEQKDALENTGVKTSKREVREGLKELPEAGKGNIVMRLAPFPSGPLHIGNARAAVLNDEYVRMYDGKFLLVMDDTIGSDKKQIEPDAYKLIEEGIKWLGINYGKKPIYKSDRTEMYYGYAEELIRKGYMYGCDCSQEDFQKLKVEGIECPCRNLPPEEHIKRWEKMFKDTTPAGSMVIRLKTSMGDPDPAFRDRVMFKISTRLHPRTKDKFRVYPSMEFSWGIDDHLFGTTHVLRGIEHQMSTRVQDFIRGIFGWANPVSIYNGLFAIEGVKISKSKGAAEVNAGTYSGWNDPRTWSLQSLRDRGFSPEAVKKFILELGTRKTNITVPVENLYLLNRKELGDVRHYFFVANPKKIKISGSPELKSKILFHPNGKLGERVIETSQEFFVSGEDFSKMRVGDFRLMHLFNFRSDSTERIKEPNFSYVSENVDGKTKLKYIPWVSAKDNVKVEVLMPDGERLKGRGEGALKSLKVGDVIYFEKFGYVKLHKKGKELLEFWFSHS